MNKKNRKKRDWIDLLEVLFWVVILAAVLGASYLIAGGNVRCMFSADPALCAAVGEVGR